MFNMENKMRKNHKSAGGHGNYIDKLREKYPFRICRKSEPTYEAVLCGIQPLLDGEEEPVYRFPGGTCVVDPFSQGIEILEW